MPLTARPLQGMGVPETSASLLNRVAMQVGTLRYLAQQQAPPGQPGQASQTQTPVWQQPQLQAQQQAPWSQQPVPQAGVALVAGTEANRDASRSMKTYMRISKEKMA